MKTKKLTETEEYYLETEPKAVAKLMKIAKEAGKAERLKEEMKIRFSKQEKDWIERTADIESSRAIMQFQSLINNTNLEKLSDEEKVMTKKIGKELIELYGFLRELRTKLEFWDCRYDIDEEIEWGLEMRKRNDNTK